MSTAIKWFMRGVQLLFVCILAATAFACYLIYLVFKPVALAEPKVYKLSDGLSAAQVADDLESRKLISSAIAFRVLLKATHNGAKLQAGEHTLPSSVSSLDVMNELLKITQLPGVSVTIPEGKTVNEMALLVEKATMIQADDLLALARSPHTRFPERTYLPPTSMEGYLFPDTYTFIPKSKPGDVLDAMLARFEKVALSEIKAAKIPQGLTLQELMTLASLVEGEAQVPGERPRIASVYYNRLRLKMNLGCDATIQYALQKRHQLVTLEDLKLDSPYNTYLHAGLPPGPICNPGIDCIRAALHPAHTDYLYYVRNDVKNDGSHVFTKSLAEHSQAIRRYQK